jgi:hypothetical protein
MAAEIIAGLGALKTAFDIAKGLKDIDNAVSRNAAVIELQEKILTAQQAQATLVESVSGLEKEVVRLKDWEADKQRYELSEIAAGIVCMALKPTMANGEPFHRICANCCAAGKKSHLQHVVQGSRYNEFKCNTCGEKLSYNTEGGPLRNSYSPRGGGGPNSWMGN